MTCVKCGRREALQRDGKQFLLCSVCGLKAIFNFCYDIEDEPVTIKLAKKGKAPNAGGENAR